MITLYILLGALYLLIGMWIASIFLIVVGSLTGMAIGSGSTPPDPRFTYPTFFFSLLLWPLALLFLGGFALFKKLGA